jgi:hypothetical protein
MKLPLIVSLLSCVTAWSAESERPTGIAQMPTYSVAPEFAFVLSHRLSENVAMFVSVDDRPELRRFPIFRSAGLESGDEVVSINGKAVPQMAPQECLSVLSRAEPGKKVELEVRTINSGAVRKVTAFRVLRSGEPQTSRSRPNGQTPNKAPEPTITSVTPPAGAGVAPAALVAHL